VVVDNNPSQVVVDNSPNQVVVDNNPCQVVVDNNPYQVVVDNIEVSMAKNYYGEVENSQRPVDIDWVDKDKD
jgi:hypothetical protein